MDGAKRIFEQIYGIKRDSPITLSHVLSVLFYTNFTELSAAFSKTYRRRILSETEYDIKDRHREYGNWGRLLHMNSCGYIT